MRSMKPVSGQTVIAYCIVLGMVTVLGSVPSAFVGAQAPATGKVEQKDKIEQMDNKTGLGRFVSFKDGMLTLKGREAVLVWSKLPENSKTVKMDYDADMFKPVEDTTAALNQLKPGAWVQVYFNKGNASIRIGERKTLTTGTFVAFKNDRLLIIGKDLDPGYIKAYGNQVYYLKFFEDVPVYESIDGGEYKLIGAANKVLGNVKEGTILTVHGQTDGNVTLVQIGVPKTK